MNQLPVVMLWANKRGRKIESRYKILTNVVSISIIPTTKMKWELINLLVNRKRMLFCIYRAVYYDKLERFVLF